MALTERLAILIDANGAQAVSEFKKVGDAANRSLGGIDDQVTRTGLKMQSLGAGAVGAGAALTFGLTKAANAAGQLEQAVGGTEAVFGQASGFIDKFAKDSATSLGLSERAFREATTGLGGSLKGLGFDTKEAAQQAVLLTRTAADLAATFGGTTADAVHALGRALVGEADPAERFNLFLNQGRVNAEAVALGLAKTTSSVDAHAKAQATLSLITKQSADAQGQFARESDTLAGKQQRAAAQLENATAQLGQGFAPILAKVTQTVADAVTVFAELDEASGGLLSTLTAYGAVALIVGGGLSLITGKVLTAAAAYRTLAVAEAEAAAGATAVNATASAGFLTRLGAAANPIVLTGAAIFGLAKAVDALPFVNESTDLSAGLRDLAKVTDDELIPAFEKAIGAFGRGFGSVQNDAFRALAEENIRTAARLRNELKDAGRDVSEFDEILADLGFAASRTSTPIGKLASDFQNYPPVLSAALEGIRGFGSGLVGLASQIDSIGSSFEPQFAFLDIQRGLASIESATKKAGGASRDYAADQHALEQATKSVTRAQQDLADAELALFLARLGPSTREKTDAELDRADASLNLTQAYEDVRNAQERLNDARKEGDPDEFREATIALERAQIGLKRAQLASEDAQKAYNDTLNSGAESSDEVKEANKRLAEAQEQLTEAQFQAEQTQKRLNEATSTGSSAVSNAGETAARVAGQYEPYIQKLIDAGASTDDIVEATKDAIVEVDKLKQKYGDLNPEIGLYLEQLETILATELLLKQAQGNRLSQAEIDSILKSGVIVPSTPPNVYEPQSLQVAGFSAGSPTPSTINLVLPGVGVIATGLMDYANSVGGIPLRTKSPN